MLMRRNAAAGIGSNEQGEYCIVERLCSDLIAKNRDINGLLYFTLLLLLPAVSSSMPTRY